MSDVSNGAVLFDVGGRQYKMVLSINALCTLEANLGASVSTIVGMLGSSENVRLSDIRTVFWATLLDHQPDTDKVSAGALMDALSLPRVMALIMTAVTRAFPEAPKGGAGPLADQTGAGTGTNF